MWVKIDDRYHQNKKTTYVGQAAADLNVAALEYCNTHLTDGFIPAVDVPKLRSYRYRARVPQWLTWAATFCQWLLRETLEDSITALTSSFEGKRPMWQRAEVEGVPGYRIHDFHEYQPKRKNVMANKRRTNDRRATGVDARTQPAASVQPAGLYVQPDEVYVQPDGESGDVRAEGVGVRAESHKDERARVPGTYDPEKNDPGTDPDLRTSNVVLLSQQQAASTQKKPPLEKRGGGNPVENPERTPNAETRTPAFLRPSPDFAPNPVRDHPPGSGNLEFPGLGIADGGREVRAPTPGLRLSRAVRPVLAGVGPGGDGARPGTPAPSPTHAGATEFTPGGSAVEGHSPAGTVRVDSGPGGRAAQRPDVWNTLKQRFAGHRERN